MEEELKIQRRILELLIKIFFASTSASLIILLSCFFCSYGEILDLGLD